MSDFKWPVLWRYLAIMVQFFIVLLVARVLPIIDAGTYFALFGFVAVASVLGGFGIPDGLVRLVPKWRINGGPIRGSVRGAILAACLFSVATISVGLGIFYLIQAKFSPIAIAVAAWLLGYCLTFIFAQACIADGRTGIGSLFQYSLVNFAYGVTLIPYLLTPEPNLQGVIWAAAGGSFLATSISALITIRGLRSGDDRVGSQGSVIKTALRTGAPMVTARMLQASLPWVPVWILVASGQPAAAALYAAASRLVVVVTSTLASIRFSVRPRLVEMLLDGRSQDVALLSRRVSWATSVLPLLAVPFLLTVGERVLVRVLGDDYSGAAVVIAVLMLGVLGECFGGLSDEILKMMDLGWVVVITLISALIVQIGMGYLVAPGGASMMALVTGFAFLLQYGLQILWLTSRTAVRIWSPSHLAAAARTSEAG